MFCKKAEKCKELFFYLARLNILTPAYSFPSLKKNIRKGNLGECAF